MQRPTRVAIYARVSTMEQDPEAQLLALRAFAAQRGFEVYREYIDYVSGGKLERTPPRHTKDTAYRALMDDVGKRRVDCVLVWKYDRFARSLSVLVSALEHFHSLGVDFISYTQHIDTTTPMGRLFYHIIGSFTELGIDITTIEVFGLELEIGVELIDGVPERVAVPNDLADRRLVVRLQQAFKGGGEGGHRLQGNIVLVDSLQIGPGAATLLGRSGPFPARTERVAASWVHRQYRFEPEVTDPVINEVVDVAETLPPMEAQRCQRHVTCVNIDVRAVQSWTSICFAMDVKRVEIGVAPREGNLERGMEGGQGHITADEEATPDQRANPLYHDPELIDMRWGNRLFHGRRVPQANEDLKWLPPESNALVQCCGRDIPQ